jgi:hypothetical protein
MSMTKAERDTLLKICPQRERVVKTEAAAISARRRAEFEAHLAAVYSYDQDATWHKAFKEAKAVADEAQKQIACRCRDLGIPPEFAHGVDVLWYGRGENASRERRAELTRVGPFQDRATGKRCPHAN